MKKLKAVRIASKEHLDLIKRGYRTHHVDGLIVWMEYAVKSGE